MTEQSNESIQAEFALNKAGRMAEGNVVLDSNGDAVTASAGPLYVDSNQKMKSGDLPYELKFSGVTNTASAVLDLQAASTVSADELMHGTFVSGASVTTFTKTGFIRVKITDDGGNLTDGYHYIQLGSLT